MKIQEAHYHHYWDKGWVVIEDVFTSDEIDPVRELATQMAFADLPARKGGGVDESGDGELAPRKINEPFRRDARFQKLALSPKLRSVIRHLMGAEPLLVTDQIFMKPPRFGSPKPYHQDNAYFKCEPAGEVMTVWIALDDVDEKNACLRYIDESFKGPVIQHSPVEGESYNITPSAELIDLSRESLAPVRKGGVVFHHANSLHSSHRNESDRWRRAYATHWASANVRSEGNTIKNAYFKDPELAGIFDE
ncbi:MAG: phytanoyl-CoA dioxygenase family protein [Planctomycetota bacterium]|nr:phytanoyl-CoA dioxygenase family protein [Planctomycetota bacterium]MDA1137635.1 phytanoyl-CoA dioxygenase family protein [Planctomycetota bacterium]